MRIARLTVTALTAAVLAVSMVGAAAAPAHAAGDSLWVWGKGTSGQIGNGAKLSVNVPTPAVLPPGVTFSSVAGGGSVCGLGTSGRAYCWGSDSFGLLGDGGPSDWSATVTPTISADGVTMPAGGVTFTKLTPARLTWCALGSDGAAYCWGLGENGEIGNGSKLNASVPTKVTMPAGVTFTQITANRQTFCALSTVGTVYCWGTGWPGTIGNGGTADATVPTKAEMPGGATIASLAAVFYATCALSTTGQVYCWGSNWNDRTGIIGNGTNGGSTTPVAVTMPVPTFTALYPRLESGTMCALASGGAAYCWGDGIYGQIGNGATSNVNVPTKVTLPGGVALAGITQYTDGMCGLTTVGSVYCWGYNGQGQMGIGSATPDKVSTPVAVQMPAATTFTTLTGAGRQMCALTSAGAAWCWGEGLDGEMGNSQSLDQYTPVPVTMPGATFASMGFGFDTFFALSAPAATTPGAPKAPVAVAGSGRATVKVSAGTGAAPVSYTVTSTPGSKVCTVTVPATSCVVTGLTNGTSYRFRATATNDGGTSTASALSNAVVPRAAQLPKNACVTAGSATTIARGTWKTLMTAGCATTAGRRVAAKVTAKTSSGAVSSVSVVCVVSGSRVAPLAVGSGYVRCASGVLKIAPVYSARKITVRWYASGSTTVAPYSKARTYTT